MRLRLVTSYRKQIKGNQTLSTGQNSTIQNRKKEVIMNRLRIDHKRVPYGKDQTSYTRLLLQFFHYSQIHHHSLSNLHGGQKRMRNTRKPLRSFVTYNPMLTKKK